MTLEEMEYIVNTTLIHLGVELKDCSKEELITINKLFITSNSTALNFQLPWISCALLP